MIDFSISPIATEDKKWIEKKIIQEWASEMVVSRGHIYYPLKLPGFIALVGNKKVGFITYSLRNNECEIVTINSFSPGYGIGTKLIEHVISKAKQNKCKRVFLITTNDNLHAQAFYKNRGFTVTAVHKDAIRESRKSKPEIPLHGFGGIEIKDEIELSLSLRYSSL